MEDTTSKKTEKLKIRITKEEKAIIERKAKATGITTSEYLRSCGLRRILRIMPTPELTEVQGHASMVKSKLMAISQIAEETGSKQILDIAENAIKQIDLCISATFKVNSTNASETLRENNQKIKSTGC
jgi:hypothetical protein